MLSIVTFPSNQPSESEPELMHLDELLNSVISQPSFDTKRDYQQFIAKADRSDVYIQAIQSSQPPTSPLENDLFHRQRRKKRRLLDKPSEESALEVSKNSSASPTRKSFCERGSEEDCVSPSTAATTKTILPTILPSVDRTRTLEPLKSQRHEKVSDEEAWRHLEDIINAVLSATNDKSEYEACTLAQEVDALTSLTGGFVTVGALPAEQCEKSETPGPAIATEPDGSTSEVELKTACPPLYVCQNEMREERAPERLPSILQSEPFPDRKPDRSEAMLPNICEGVVRGKDLLSCPPTGDTETRLLTSTEQFPSPSLQTESADSSTTEQLPRALQNSLLTNFVLPTPDPGAQSPSLAPENFKDTDKKDSKTSGPQCSVTDEANRPDHCLSDRSRGNDPRSCPSKHKVLNVPFAEEHSASGREPEDRWRKKFPNLSVKWEHSFSCSNEVRLGVSHKSERPYQDDTVEECTISTDLEQHKCDESLYPKKTPAQFEKHVVGPDLTCKFEDLSSAGEQSTVTTDDSGVDLLQTINKETGRLSSDKSALEINEKPVSMSSPYHDAPLSSCKADTCNTEGSKMPQTAEPGSLPVVLTTYEVAIRDASFLEKINFKCLRTKLSAICMQALVVDEAQRIKRASSKLFQCLKGFDADIRLVVTGTPLQNNVSELWSLLHFILPEIFPLGTDFSMWFDPIGLVEQVGRDRLAAQEAEHALVTNLRKVIRPFMLRRTKAEANVFLPPKREVVLRVAMAPIQKTLYDFVIDTLRKEGVLFAPKKQPGGSITKLDKRNILPERRRSAPGISAKEHVQVSSSDERPTLEAEVKSQPKRRIGRARKVQPTTAPTDVDSGAYSSSATNSDFESFLPKAANPQENPYNFEFLPDVMRSNRLMLLRRIVNHPYLAIEPPDDFYSPQSSQRSSQERGEEEEVLSNRLESLLSTSGKMCLLDKLLQKLLAEGHKTLIFSQFTMALDIIEELLKVRKWDWVRLDGAMRFETRQTAVHRFNTTTAAELPIFLLSTRAGGLGLNLQAAADTVIIHDSDWNPQLDLQAQDRCHRIGQEKPVLVLRLLSAGTIEEAIYARAFAKKGLERLLLYKNTTSTGSTDFLEFGEDVSDDFESATMASKNTLETNQASGKRRSINALSESKDNFDLLQLLDAPEQATEPTIDANLISDAELQRILSRNFDDQTIPDASEDNTKETFLEPMGPLPLAGSPALKTHGKAEVCTNHSGESVFSGSEAKAQVHKANCYSGRRPHIPAKLTTDEIDHSARTQCSRKLNCKSPIAKATRHSAKRSRVDTNSESQVSPDSSDLAHACESTEDDGTAGLVKDNQKMEVFSSCSKARKPSALFLRRSPRSPATSLLGTSRLTFKSSEEAKPVAASDAVKPITTPAPQRRLLPSRCNVTPVSQRLLRSGLTRRQPSKQPNNPTAIVEVVKTTKSPLRHVSPSKVDLSKPSISTEGKSSGNCDLAPKRSSTSQSSSSAPNTVSQLSISTSLRHCTGLRRSAKSFDRGGSARGTTVLFSKFKPPAVHRGPKNEGSPSLLEPKGLVDEVEE
ncbi:hypothetical protein SprV_0200818300 [Sparganum proliferum]